jgi:hypothetical protein
VCAGDTLWEGSALLESATHQQALLTAALLGLRAAEGLGLGSTGCLVLQSFSQAALDQVFLFLRPLLQISG